MLPSFGKYGCQGDFLGKISVGLANQNKKQKSKDRCHGGAGERCVHISYINAYAIKN